MERRKPQSITNLIKLFLHDVSLETPLLQHRLIESWPMIVGTEIAHLTEALEIRDEVLWVRVSSPAMATELQMKHSHLTTLLNTHIGAMLIRDIRFVL